MSLIVNADDFGKDCDTNRAIIQAFEKNYVDRTTLMANMEGRFEAEKLAKENGITDRVGIHFNITEGRPLTEGIKSNPLICGMDGSFSAAFYHKLKYRLYMDELTITQIREELESQLQNYHALGFSLNHVDSHHHVHTNYPVYKAVKQLADIYSFSSIRLSRNLYRGGNFLNRIYKMFYNRSLSKLSEKTTGIFGSYRDYMSYFGLDADNAEDRRRINSAFLGIDTQDEEMNNIAARMKAFNQKYSIEIMVHPMYIDGVLTDSKIPMDEEVVIHHE